MAHRLKPIFDLALLFASRVGGVLATLFFVPQYNSLAGPVVFGAISIIISLQAFFLMSDFGLATVVGRDTAIARGNPNALRSALSLRKDAEAFLLITSIAISLVSVLFCVVTADWLSSSVLGALNVGLVAILIASLVTINLFQLSYNALGGFRASAIASLLGALFRGSVTVLALRVSPTFEIFLIAQAISAIIQCLFMRASLDKYYEGHSHSWSFRWDSIINLCRRCLPLMIYTMFGAAALNFDKVIVGWFFSLDTAGQYFLATTYALVPIAILSGPLNSYFSPLLTNALHAGDFQSVKLISASFQCVVICAVVGPSLALALDGEYWIPLWLGQGANITLIVDVVPILLVGSALSATGYYFSTYLIAVGDNAFMAILSMITSVIVLLAAIYFSVVGRIDGMAWSYVGFYFVSLIVMMSRVGLKIGGADSILILFKSYCLPLAVCFGGYFVGALLYGNAEAKSISLVVPMFFSVCSGLFYFIILRAWLRRNLTDLN